MRQGMRVLEKSEYHFLPALKIPLSRNIAFIPNSPFKIDNLSSLLSAADENNWG